MITSAFTSAKITEEGGGLYLAAGTFPIREFGDEKKVANSLTYEQQGVLKVKQYY
ncbi:hypothetical protein GQ53DRAFT_743480 [Thozetella sp. PMI_491]|nr:hypothetical protein GQ53DRAFT_743480 [Thozetella sp. PMI_491]